MAKTKLQGFYAAPYKARVQNGVSCSYMDAIFKLVAHGESEIWTRLPQTFFYQGAAN